MHVSDIMTTGVYAVTPQTTLKEVAALLDEHFISGVPVVDADGVVVGVISEGDFLFKQRGPYERAGVLSRLLHSDGNARMKLEARTAAEAMTMPPRTIAGFRTLAAAAAEMLDAGVNRLPVVDLEGKLVGIITRADLVRAFLRPDAAIKREIVDEVLRTLWIDHGEVTVAVENGEVQLDGRVATKADAESVERFVRRVPGVVSLDSRVTWRDGDGRSG
jgi:CBS domain-containing protein